MEDGELGDDEEEGDGGADEVRHAVEEVEVGGFDGHDQHDPGGDGDGEERDYVHGADRVEDYEGGAGELGGGGGGGGGGLLFGEEGEHLDS